MGISQIQPVFIIGCPRSGTTYFLNLMASHGAFSWISGQLNKEPEQLWLAEKCKIFDQFYSGKRKYVKPEGSVNGLLPVESWNFYNHYLPGFQWSLRSNTIPKNPDSMMFSVENREHFAKVVNETCKLSGKSYFLAKYTDFPRIELIKSIFPNAKFIQLSRDGNSVAYSYYQKMMNQDFKSWEEKDFWVKSWDIIDQESFIKIDTNQMLAFSAYQWLNFEKKIEQEAQDQLNSSSFLKVRYENLSTNKSQLQEILDFLNLKMSSRMKFFLKHKPPLDFDSKWKKNLTEAERETLTSICRLTP